MNKYDFARRLKRIAYEQCEIVKAESKTAHKSARHYEELTANKTTLIKQEQDLKKLQKHIEKLIHGNDKLRKLKQEQEEQLTVLAQKVEQLDVEYNTTLQKKIEQRRTELLKMDCFRSLKLVSQTYINLTALPQLIKGVTISEKDSSNVWKPFCINPLSHTQKEVEDIIWHEPQMDSELKNTWESLIFGDILSNENQLKEMDTSKGNV